MSAFQQFSADTHQEEYPEATLQHMRKDCVRGGPCPTLQLLSESAAKLLMPTQSHDELRGLTSARLRTYVRHPGSDLELETFRPSARPTSSASLTLIDYGLPSSGESTPTSSGGSSCSITGYSNDAAASSGDDSIGSSVFAAAAASVPAPDDDDDDIDPKDPHPILSDPPTKGDPAPGGEAAAPPVRGDEDGPFAPREIHAVDVQLARMLAAVSPATSASPAQLLQVLLNFAPEDHQDLVNALAESGCSSGYLLACHLHNLRTMAEEAIDDTSGDDGDDAPAAGGGPTAAARPGKAAADGAAGRKGGAAGAAASPQRDAGPEGKDAQEALRASILDQYRRVVCRLMDTALSFMQQDSAKVHVAAPPPPPPPPPRGQSGGDGGRGRAGALDRSRSTPIPSSSIPVIPPPPPPPGTASAASRGGPGSKALSAGAAPPRAAATPRVGSAGAAPSGGGATAFADPDATAAGALVDGVLQAAVQQLGPGTAAEAGEAWTGPGLGAAAAGGATTAATEQLLDSRSALAARPSMSQPLTAAARKRSVTVNSYMGAGSGAGTPAAVQPAISGRHAGAGPAAPQTLRAVAVAGQSRTVANAPQRLYLGEVRLDPRHAAALLLQQERQLQQQQLLQHRLQLQRLQQQQVQHRRLQQQLQHQQQLQIQQHLHQHLQQQHLQQQQQQLRELQLLELLAAANADVGAPFGLVAQGVMDPCLQVMPPPPQALAPQADALSVAAAAHLMHTYDASAAAATAFAEPHSVWRPTDDPMAALQQQLHRQQVPLAVPFAANPAGHAAPLHHIALSQHEQHQQLMLAMQGGLLPAVGAEAAVGGHAAAAGAAVPFGTMTAFGAQLLSSGWMV